MFGNKDGRITRKLTELSSEVEVVMGHLDRHKGEFAKFEDYFSINEELEAIRGELSKLVTLSQKIHRLIEQNV